MTAAGWSVGSSPAAAADEHAPLHRYTPTQRAKDIAEAIRKTRIGWFDANLVGHRPSGTHAEHRYEGSCGVCRAAEHEGALLQLIDAVLNADAMRRGRLSGSVGADPLEGSTDERQGGSASAPSTTPVPRPPAVGSGHGGQAPSLPTAAPTHEHEGTQR